MPLKCFHFTNINFNVFIEILSDHPRGKTQLGNGRLCNYHDILQNLKPIKQICIDHTGL